MTKVMDQIRQRIMWEVNRRTIAHLQVAVNDRRLSQVARDRARRMLMTAITVRELKSGR